MLLDRARPNGQQGFGDYLCDLAKTNGFSDIKRFKLFLAKSSQKRYRIGTGYNQLMGIISGLFIELGVDQTEESDIGKRVCFECMRTEPKRWIWRVLEEEVCASSRSCRNYFDSPCGEYRIGREEFCGLMRFSVRRLGLDFSPEKEGLYFADILSKIERDEKGSPCIYPDYKAFTMI